MIKILVSDALSEEGLKILKSVKEFQVDVKTELKPDELKKIIKEYEGEVWCISKHLLATTMRLMEVGTKYQKDGKTEEADKIFKQAFHIYSMFWALRLKIIDLAGVKKIDDDKLNKEDKEGGNNWTTEDLVNKLVNCCNE